MHVLEVMMLLEEISAPDPRLRSSPRMLTDSGLRHLLPATAYYPAA